MAKTGPKVDPRLGPLSQRTLMLDDDTLTMAGTLGTNVSDGVRKAVRTAYRINQRTVGDPLPVCAHCLGTGCEPAPGA